MTELSDFYLDLDSTSEKVRETFSTHGVAVARGLVSSSEIMQFCEAFEVLIEAALARHGKALAPGTDLDQAYKLLCATDSEAALALKGLGKDLAEYHKFLVNEGILRVVGVLLGSARFQINYDQCLFRIDRPAEQKLSFTWHQDYPYNLLSKNAVTVWMPLTGITQDVGPLRVVPGSHARLHPIIIDKASDHGRFAKHNSIRIANHDSLAEEFEVQGVDIVGLAPGDVLFIHSHLVHRSGRNRSERCRWVFNPRYGNLVDRQVVDRYWQTARHKSPFLVEELHPEVVVRPENR